MLVRVHSFFGVITLDIDEFFNSDFDKIIIEQCERFDDFSLSLVKWNWSYILAK